MAGREPEAGRPGAMSAGLRRRRLGVAVIRFSAGTPAGVRPTGKAFLQRALAQFGPIKHLQP